ncbi:tryptophan-rich sensory protein [Paraclostridium bifermentans]|uniref:Tryptophan-rich sensory protein n=1 Tax=Paraclostridium bifermentans TaxID=1490 RepID=A0ABY8R827_PARBF|nr:tryptophan-rich sensory protein [Paraclostridium bifermentans]
MNSLIISTKEIKKFIISVFIPIIVGFSSSFISEFLSQTNTSTYYSNLIKPGFFPPGYIFPIVWTILYVLMGISAYLISKKGLNTLKVRDAMFYYYLQLGLNFIWTILFFGLGLRFTALIVIGLMIIIVLIMIIKFAKIDKRAAYINLPYLAWLFYAFFLNYVIWSINR